MANSESESEVSETTDADLPDLLVVLVVGLVEDFDLAASYW